jgi:outer membrane protein assembly factor BamB
MDHRSQTALRAVSDVMGTPSFARQITVLLVALSLVTTAFAADNVNWPRMRGPDGTGVAPAAISAPVKWSDKEIVWKTPLKGRGHSSPVIWGDRIFLTTALEDGHERLVLCVDRNTGKILWEHSAWKGEPEKTHKMNGWATPTCITDGQHVWAWFGKPGVFCYTMDGKQVWAQQLGQFTAKNGRGTASSLAIVGNILLVNGDSDTDPYLFGLDKATGKTIWKAERAKDEGFSTPVVLTVGGKEQVVLNGPDYVAAYDPADGKQIWKCKSFAGRGEPMPAVGKNNLLIMVNGLSGDIYAVKPDGQGDVTNSHMAWHTPRKGKRDEPSPTVVGDYLLVSDMYGMLTCYDANSGKELWKEAIVEQNKKPPLQVTAAPLAVGNKVYFVFEHGETVVVEPGPKLNIVSKNPISGSKDELFRASPAVGDGRIYIRSDQMLYCVK